MIGELIAAGRKYAAEYGPHFHNHLPMALVALHRLGASPAHCKRFFDSYVGRLSPRRAAEMTIDEETWHQHLGLHEFNTEYRSFFATEIERHGVDATLHTFLPRLLPGLSGGAFHPMIRLAYALELGDLWEVSESLAAWCLAYQELGPADGARSARTPLETLEAVSSLRGAVDAPSIHGRMKAIAEQPGFVRWAEGMPSTLAELADVALRIYASTDDNFTALHGVTSSHAARLVAPHCGDARMRAHGFAPVPSFNPYWDRNGLTFEDVDGYRVVLQNARAPHESR